MKLLNKLTKLVVSALMVFSMGVTAFAEGETTYTITGPADGHTYEVYQILTGDLSEDGSTLSNVKAGTNYNTEKGDVAAAAAAIAKLETNTQATATAVAGYVNFSSTPVATLTDSNKTASVDPGYYLIKDTGATTGTTDSYSTYIVTVVKDVTIKTKKDTPTFQKKIKDTNDSKANSTTDWQDSADYDIGDAVPFQLKGTIPSNYGSYTTYYYQFTDQMEPSLTFNADSVVVKVGDTTLTKGTDYTVTTGKVTSSDSYNGGDTFTVTFANLKNVSAVTAGSTITVEYTATLNENAVLGSTGNVNEAKLTYSNNPNKSGEGDNEHGETPWDNVIVFTYQTVVNKVDQDKKPLAGAEFTLYKKLADGSQKEITAVKAESGTSFTFKGLDDGDYVLKETKTPDGYSTATDINFTITADHDVEWTTQARTEVLNTLSGGDLGTGNVTTGTITTEVVNKKGSALPSTGGIGTTIFYVVGGMMVVVAGVLLITKKRMSNN